MSQAADVSRETLDKLSRYAEILKKWNPSINLVAKSTIEDLWSRHILDSLQVMEHIPSNTAHLVDLGSGGGFPGLVIALAAHEGGNPAKVTMIESDQRKSVFLRTVLRETSVAASVITERIEAVAPQGANVLTARALADLNTLLGFAERHMASDGVALFLKGRNWRKELVEAQKFWQFEWSEIQSKTSDEAILLKVQGVKRV